MTEDAAISVVSAATRIACRQMTLQHLDVLQASLEQASGLSARPDWERKATAHAELFTLLGALTGDGDLALLVSSAAGRLHDLVLRVGPAADGIILSSRRRLLRQLRAWDADGAAREMEHHLKGLRYMGRLAYGASPARITQVELARAAERPGVKRPCWPGRFGASPAWRRRSGRSPRRRS